MILDEAIKHAEEVAEEKESEAQDLEYSKLDWRYEANQCSECADEHRQLAEWLKELKQLRAQTRWIPVSERLPEEHICDDGWHEPSDYVLVFTKCRCMHVTRWWSRFDERWVDLKYPTTDKVIAWMPLPKACREVEK